MSGLNKKPMIRASRGVVRVLDKLSKATLGDMVLDRVKAEVGEDADDMKIIDVLQRWLNPVANVREQSPENFRKVYAKYAASDERYRKEHGIA